MKKKILIILIEIIIVAGACIFFYFRKKRLDFEALSPEIVLVGDSEMELGLNDVYDEPGVKAVFDNKDITSKVKINGNVDVTKVGTYKIVYEIKANNKTVSTERIITIVDKDNPEIILEGDINQSYYINSEYTELGFSASDNVDGDLTSKVIIENSIDFTNPGTYYINYKVTDSSGNEASASRVINVIPYKKLPSENANATSIAVLNYHFFYDEGESQGGGNFMRTDYFEEQLKFLKDNGYKTLTMEEFRAWMYGEIELPARSVLITIDDGAQGTGFHNGNKLIPLLEKYEAHATLFLITGWWSIDNYRSEYLDIESHSDNMHTSNYCTGVSRGAKILCLSDEEVLADLKQSIAITGSTTAFCFPFYAYSEHAIELVKQAGFQLAFGGGSYKATRNSNKFAIPRYHMQDFVELGQFVSMIA